MQRILGEIAAPDDDLRMILRHRTRREHERLDAALGRLDLAEASGLARFLLAHAHGLRRVLPPASAFAARELGGVLPDLSATVAQDLADLGIDVAAWLGSAPPEAPSPAPAAGEGQGAGLAYVLIGSRLGMAVLRRRGYWHSPTLPRCRYMEDDSLAPLWPRLVAWLGDAGPEATDPALAGARAGFAAFEAGVARARDFDASMGGVAAG